MANNELGPKKDLRAAINFRGAKVSSVGAIKVNGKRITTTTYNGSLYRRSFTLKDYKWSDNYEINGTDSLVDYDSIPKLIMVEKQPKKKVDWSKILSDMTALGELPLVEKFIRATTSVAQTGSQIAGSVYLNNLADKYSSSVAESNKLLDISAIDGLIEGEVVNTYEIPFYNNTYLSSNSKDGWTMGNAIDSAGRFGELMNDGFNMNIMKSPQWSNNNSEGPGWDTEFFLLNDDLEALQKNFTFINALYPSTQWVHMTGSSPASENIEDAVNAVGEYVESKADGASIGNLSLAYTKSPNVFRVECPGRFIQLFVAIDMTIEFVGNVRKMPLYTKITDVPMVNENTLYPDAYKVSISARDLTPPCFNVYANYLMGNQKVRITSESN